MHLKLFFSFFVLGYCTATFLGERYITVNHVGDRVQITSEIGAKLEIVEQRLGGLFGLKNFDIVLTGPNFYKTFQINNQQGGDILFNLFVQHQGVMDDLTYEKILYKVEHFVQQGVLHPKIFYMLKSLNDKELIQYLMQEDILGEEFHKINHHGFFGKNLYNKQYYPTSMFQGKFGQYYGQQYTTPSVWRQIFHKTQYPYGGLYDHQGFTGMNQYTLNKMVENQLENKIEHEIEREVEQEVEQKLENQLENQMMHKYYGQVMPFQHRMFFNNVVVPKTHQFYGMTQYNRPLGYFGDYLRQVRENNMFYDHSPVNHNMYMGYPLRMPVY